MKKRLIPAIILLAYSALLIKVMVFKSVPAIKTGGMTLNFGGTNGDNPANLIPFKTILPYLLGDKGWLIGGLNLVGNIVLLVPLGFLAPLVYRKLSWKKSLLVALGSGLVIECLQTVLHVGIFDIDDVILNAFGVMIGYWAFTILVKWVRSKKYKTIILTLCLLTLIATAMATYCALSLFKDGQRPVNREVGAEIKVNAPQQGNDPCGGTGGTGQIISSENHAITIQSKKGDNQVINISDSTTIKNAAGPALESDLKIGDRVTIVIYDGKTASAVFVCNQ